MTATELPLLSSGDAGLDSILRGGLPAHHTYLVLGRAGTGKTTLVLQFLSQGTDRGEPTVYVSFSESQLELQDVADAHGWPIDDIEVAELATTISQRSAAGSSIFHSTEVELPDAISRILDIVERVQPTRVGIDSLTELRNMAESNRSYRRALFQLKASLQKRGVTTFFVGEKGQRTKTEAESLVHGVIELHMETPNYGPVHRYLEIRKVRGRTYESGFHDFSIISGGLEVYPRIRPRDTRRQIGNDHPVQSGVPSLDKLLGGGLDRGTTTLVVGPSGVGKSSLVMQYVIAAAQRGEKSILYTFSEGQESIKRRAHGMGLPLSKCLTRGDIRIKNLDSEELTPGHFAHLVQQEVNHRDVAFVAIDSLNGYVQAMPGARALIPNLRNLLTYLGARGIVMMLVMSQNDFLSAQGFPKQLTYLNYLADTVLHLDFFKQGGAIHKSIAALKQRTRDHEKFVRRLTLGRGGVQLGEPLEQDTTSFEPASASFQTDQPLFHGDHHRDSDQPQGE